jgi:type IV secretory pathway TrbF-like protein
MTNQKLVEQFVKAINHLSAKPAAVRQVLRDAYQYKKDDTFTADDMAVIRKAANQYGI